MTLDPHHLERFLEAQANAYTQALTELRAGRKHTHWIWFIFPQISGLGFSPTSQFYAIQSLQEAEAYIQHPVLGARLRECTQTVNAHEGLSALTIFGSPDDMKFHSSVTLFARATEDNEIFLAALRKYFDSQPDANTLSRI